MSWNKSSISARWQGVAILALLIVLPFAALAAVPQLINYQGILTDGAGLPVPDGSYLINFKIYASPTYPAWLWASGPQSVTVSSGNFSYLLGSQVSFPAQLFDSDTIRYLGITVGADPELSPRTRLVSAPYSFKALHADTSDYATTVPDQSISGAKLVDGTITDADVSATADIDPAKIDGTAMVLSASWQTVNGFVEFTGPNVYMHDSTVQSSQYGLTIGSRAAHSPDGALLEVSRDYNSAASKYGTRVRLDNASTGSLQGIRSEVEHTTAGSGGSAYGAYSHAISDGSQRTGVYGLGESQNSSITTGISCGVSGSAFDGATAYGILGYATSATTNYAGYFSGNVQATGVVIKAGGTFRIDHPLDPENKYLQHSFVESPDMMNIYNGNSILDSRGEAEIELPEWFEALNRDFRYQLTAIGRPGPNLHVAAEIRDNRFRIAGGEPGMTVSWQVTGVRRDPWAEANRIQVEVDKNADEQGKYMHPKVYNRPIEQAIDYESLRPILEKRAERK